MTASIEERRAFAEYLADCDANAIVPDVAGAFAWAWRKPVEAAIRQARIDALEEARAICIRQAGLSVPSYDTAIQCADAIESLKGKTP